MAQKKSIIQRIEELESRVEKTELLLSSIRTTSNLPQNPTFSTPKHSRPSDPEHYKSRLLLNKTPNNNKKKLNNHGYAQSLRVPSQVNNINNVTKFLFKSNSTNGQTNGSNSNRSSTSTPDRPTSLLTNNQQYSKKSMISLRRGFKPLPNQSLPPPPVTPPHGPPGPPDINRMNMPTNLWNTTTGGKTKRTKKTNRSTKKKR